MMKLSTMLKVDSTVDSQGKSRIAECILEQWEHDRGSAQFFRSSSNFVYVFCKGGERYFLRFAESAERSGTEILAEIALLGFLASQGMRVSTPVVSTNGRFEETVETALGSFHAVVFAQLPGRELDIDELSVAQFENWGATLGKLHALTYLSHNPSLFGRRTWRDHMALARNVLSKDEPRVQAEFEYLSSFLAALPLTATNHGLIHGDFELDNLRWQGDTIAVLDFDDCSYSWYVTDIAFALRDLFQTGVDLNHPSFRAFMRGYREQYLLDEELISHLPTWMRLVNLITYAKLIRAMDLEQGQDYPVAFTLLLLKLEKWIRNYKASLLLIPV